MKTSLLQRAGFVCAFACTLLGGGQSYAALQNSSSTDAMVSTAVDNPVKKAEGNMLKYLRIIMRDCGDRIYQTYSARQDKFKQDFASVPGAFSHHMNGTLAENFSHTFLNCSGGENETALKNNANMFNNKMDELIESLSAFQRRNALPENSVLAFLYRVNYNLVMMCESYKKLMSGTEPQEIAKDKAFLEEWLRNYDEGVAAAKKKAEETPDLSAKNEAKTKKNADKKANCWKNSAIARAGLVGLFVLGLISAIGEKACPSQDFYMQKYCTKYNDVKRSMATLYDNTIFINAERERAEKEAAAKRLADEEVRRAAEEKKKAEEEVRLAAEKEKAEKEAAAKRLAAEEEARLAAEKKKAEEEAAAKRNSIANRVFCLAQYLPLGGFKSPNC